MWLESRRALGVVCILCIGCLTARAATPAVQHELVEVSMRDGVKLSKDIYRDPALDKAPVLLLRTPYGKEREKPNAERFAAAGYVAVVQDARGRPPSEGAFVPYNNEGQDGYDTVEWIGQQPWSNGNVGMWGGSYVGAVQWQAAVERPPGLKVITPTYTWTSFYRNLYLGGAVRLSLIASWAANMSKPANLVAPQKADWERIFMHLPLSDIDSAVGWSIPWLKGMFTHPTPDGYWTRLNLTNQVSELELPAQHIVGYYDFFSRESVASFQQMQQRARNPATRRQQQLILGPWEHGPTGSKVGDVDFGPAANVDAAGENLQWFNRYLKRDPQALAERFPAVRYFVMGANTWKESETWPPAGAKPTPFYLHSQGRANSLDGDGQLLPTPPKRPQAADSFRADPADPVPANPVTPTRSVAAAIWGPVDQTQTEQRQDVLVYTSPALAKPLLFAGNVSAELAVSTDTPDADWVAKLIDVRPDGFAQNLAVGIIRGSFRDSETQPTPMTPGKIYRVVVDLGPVAAEVGVGHKLRVDISGAHFPLYDRNANTAEGPYGERMLVATSKVHHDKQALSRVILPVRAQ